MVLFRLVGPRVDWFVQWGLQDCAEGYGFATPAFCILVLEGRVRAFKWAALDIKPLSGNIERATLAEALNVAFAFAFAWQFA